MWEDKYYFLQVASRFDIHDLETVGCFIRNHDERSVNIATEEMLRAKLQQHEKAIHAFFANHHDLITGDVEWSDAIDELLTKYRAASYDALESGQKELARSILMDGMKYVRPRSVAKFFVSMTSAIVGRKVSPNGRRR